MELYQGFKDRLTQAKTLTDSESFGGSLNAAKKSGELTDPQYEELFGAWRERHARIRAEERKTRTKAIGGPRRP